jgi:hypothetical protein
MPEALRNWLRKVNARAMWREKIKDTDTEVFCAIVGVVVVLVQLYGKDGKDGFDIFTPTQRLSTEATFADAESRCGLEAKNV